MQQGFEGLGPASVRRPPQGIIDLSIGIPTDEEMRETCRRVRPKIVGCRGGGQQLWNQGICQT